MKGLFVFPCVRVKKQSKPRSRIIIASKKAVDASTAVGVAFRCLVQLPDELRGVVLAPRLTAQPQSDQRRLGKARPEVAMKRTRIGSCIVRIQDKIII